MPQRSRAALLGLVAGAGHAALKHLHGSAGHWRRPVRRDRHGVPDRWPPARQLRDGNDFATDFDGGSHVGAASNPAVPALVLAIIGSVTAVAAFLCGPGRWSATSAVLLFLIGGPIWFVTVQLLAYY